MKRRYDDEDERPSWVGRLVKGILAGVIVSAAAVAAISIFVLPPPAPPPPEPEVAETDPNPSVVDGIEVATQPAYFGAAESETGEAGGETATPAPEESAGPVELSGPALVVNSIEFEPPADKPLLAVVIDDAGASPMLHESLFALDMPLTVGVVAGGAGDSVTAQAAWDAGFEIVAQLPFAMSGEAEGAALEYNLPPEEAARRTELLMRRLPMAVAAARPMATPVAPDPDMLEGIMDTLGPLGFAWLEHGVPQDRAGIAATSDMDAIFAVSRFAIPAGTNAADAHALLDRAAARAVETGGVIVMAPAEEPVLMALQLWSGAGEAVLAPLSAVVRRQNGGDVMPEAPATAEEPQASGTPETAEASQPAN